MPAMDYVKDQISAVFWKTAQLRINTIDVIQVESQVKLSHQEISSLLLGETLTLDPGAPVNGDQYGKSPQKPWVLSSQEREICFLCL